MVLRGLHTLQARALERRGFLRRRIRTPVGDVHALDAHGAGELPTVVLLHGLSASGADYESLLERLRRYHRRVVAPDLLGHGLSHDPGSALRLHDLEQALVAALDQLIDEPAWIFGNSLGGAAAVRYGALRPDRVRGLLLASPGGAPMDLDSRDGFLRVFDMRTHSEALSFMDNVTRQSGMARHAYAFVARQRFRRPSVRALIRDFDPSSALSPEDLARLTMPTLVLWGTEERILPESHLPFWKEHLPEHAELQEPGGFTHVPHIDHADDLADRLVAFVRGAEGGRS